MARRRVIGSCSSRILASVLSSCTVHRKGAGLKLSLAMTPDSRFDTSSPPRRAGAYTFAALFAVESFVRALNSTVVTLQAYDILGAAQKVSVLSTAVSMVVLVATLFLPHLLGPMPRRWAYTMGIAMMMAASLALASHMVAGQAAGMLLRNLGAAVLNITLQLYIMDHIRRTDLARTEPLRLSLSTFSWMTGPALGVWLYVQYGPWAPQALAIASAAALFALFWFVRLSESASGQSAPPVQAFNARDNVVRFWSQPRLRLAWIIAFGRSCFWSTFFIYGPLLLVEAGLAKTMGGLMISASQAVLLTAWFSGRFAIRYGVRTVITAAFVVCALTSLLAGLAGTLAPYIAIACLLLGSVAASALDGVGGIPFLRAVHHHERQKMTAVYRTYIDCSELIPAFVFAFALLWLPIGFVFVILAAALLVIAWVSWRYLPRSL